jgi:hypothetical protein
MSLEFAWPLLESFEQFLESVWSFIEHLLSFSEQQPYKLIYDLFIAVVIGYIIGRVVDKRIKRREQHLLLPAANLMYSELINIISELMTRTVPTQFGGRAWKKYRFGDSVAALPYEFEDENILSNNVFEETLKKAIRDLYQIYIANPQPNDPTPREIDALRNAKRRLNEIFGAQSVLEPETRTLLLDLHSKVSTLSESIDKKATEKNWGEVDFEVAPVSWTPDYLGSRSPPGQDKSSLPA